MSTDTTAKDDFLKQIMDNEHRPLQEGGLFPLDIFREKEIKVEKKCNDPEHGPPMYYSIPQGYGYKHVCPSCGKSQVIIPPQQTM